MPAIKRWFPVSHDFNRDPEIRELCKKFGLTGLRAWLEMLSIADRNEGALPGDFNAYPGIIAGACESTTRHSREVCEWLTRWLRVDHEGITRVANCGKYHRSWEHYPLSPDLSGPILTGSYQNKNQNSRGGNGPEIGKKRGLNLTPELKEQTDRLYGANPAKFKRLVLWLNQGRKHGFSESDMAEALRQFWDYRDVDNWYPYLDTILDKVVKNRNREEFLSEHESYRRLNNAKKNQSR